MRALRAASGDVAPFVLAGAQARDLLLKHAHGIETGRQTMDVDFAFRVGSWDQFLSVREQLLASGDFIEDKKVIHKVRYRNVLEVDIIPFGDIEKPDRTIEWPPSGDIVMSMFGFREVFNAALTAELPEGQNVNVVSLPALALLKLAAWRDRRKLVPGKDAYDLRLILRNYLDAGNRDRLYSEFSSLVGHEDFDYEEAGAFILGQDISMLLDASGRARVDKDPSIETDPHGQLALVGDMKIEPLTALKLLTAMRTGLLGAESLKSG